MCTDLLNSNHATMSHRVLFTYAVGSFTNIARRVLTTPCTHSRCPYSTIGLVCVHPTVST